MIIIGVDFHPEFQQIASVDTDTGEFQEKRLTHPEEAEKFYRALIGKKRLTSPSHTEGDCLVDQLYRTPSGKIAKTIQPRECQTLAPPS